MAKGRQEHGRGVAQLFADFSSVIAKLSGRPPVFAFAALYIAAWAASGPIFGFSDTWQLIMNTASSIVTFLMVFIIQNTQARDSEALQAKLDELILSINSADDRAIGIERKTDQEIEAFREKQAPRRVRRH